MIRSYEKIYYKINHIIYEKIGDSFTNMLLRAII